MNITIHYSGSSGNFYQIDNILIEVGVPIKQIKKDLDYKLSNISGCLISHFHGDHACAAKDIMKAGIDVYASIETFKQLKLVGHRAKPIKAMESFNVESWKILPFDAIHDVPCFGFLLVSQRSKILYLVDSAYCKYRFRNLTHIMLGVSYSTEILTDNILCGYINPEVGKRMLKTHMSFKTAKEFFRANDMSQVKEIYLIHLSDVNSNAEKFKQEIQGITGKPVYI